MKKLFFLTCVMIIFLVIGVFAVPISDTDENVSEFVENFVEKRGINQDSINSIDQVDFDSLPKEVNIKNVGDNNLAIYKIDYKENNQEKQVYVVTYSVEKLKTQGDIILAQDKREFLNFGHKGVMSESGFLETATGVETSLDKGYVMVRDGSITAISTNLEIENAGLGSIEIIIYKNREQVNFGNTLDTNNVGIKNDYDVQSNEIVSFEAGDVISAYALVHGNEGISFKDVTTLVEITTTN